MAASYLGGVTVAAGDITGDTRADLVVGKAIGGTLRVLDGVTGATVMTKSPFGSMFLGGVNVAAGSAPTRTAVSPTPSSRPTSRMPWRRADAWSAARSA